MLIVQLLLNALIHSSVSFIDPSLESFIRRGKFFELFFHFFVYLFRGVVYPSERDVRVVNFRPLQVLGPDFLLLAILGQSKGSQISGNLRSQSDQTRLHVLSSSGSIEVVALLTFVCFVILSEESALATRFIDFFILFSFLFLQALPMPSLESLEVKVANTHPGIAIQARPARHSFRGFFLV